MEVNGIMIDDRFKEDQEVHQISFDDNYYITSGQNGVDKIAVVMEYGQLAGVPWFAVWKRGKIASKHNAQYVVSVVL